MVENEEEEEECFCFICTKERKCTDDEESKPLQFHIEEVAPRDIYDCCTCRLDHAHKDKPNYVQTNAAASPTQ